MLDINHFHEIWLHLEYSNWRPVIVWSHCWIKQPFASCSCCCCSSSCCSCCVWGSIRSNPSNWSGWSWNLMDCVSEWDWLGPSNSIGWCCKPGMILISVNVADVTRWNWCKTSWNVIYTHSNITNIWVGHLMTISGYFLANYMKYFQ